MTAGFSLTFPVADLRQRSQQARRELLEARALLLQLIGIQLLSFQALDYEKKSRGQSGVDGVSWKPLDPKTIKRKNRRGGKPSSKKKKGGNPAPAVFASTQIGVDLGLQRASVSPGFQGSDGQGGNVFELSADFVTVGYGRSYSQYFDEIRPIMPEELPAVWVDPLLELVSNTEAGIIEDNFT